MEGKLDKTKIELSFCEDCGRQSQILCSTRSQIVSMRCSKCFKKWKKRNEKIMLKQKGVLNN